jgi:hypothetical protein
VGRGGDRVPVWWELLIRTSDRAGARGVVVVGDILRGRRRRGSDVDGRITIGEQGGRASARSAIDGVRRVSRHRGLLLFQYDLSFTFFSLSFSFLFLFSRFLVSVSISFLSSFRPCPPDPSQTLRFFRLPTFCRAHGVQIEIDFAAPFLLGGVRCAASCSLMPAILAV